MANPYEEACDRFEAISTTYAARIKEYQEAIDAIENEYNEAWRNLRRYESQPGVPLPEYRKELQEQ